MINRPYRIVPLLLAWCLARPMFPGELDQYDSAQLRDYVEGLLIRLGVPRDEGEKVALHDYIRHLEISRGEPSTEWASPRRALCLESKLLSIGVDLEGRRIFSFYLNGAELCKALRGNELCRIHDDSFRLLPNERSAALAGIGFVKILAGEITNSMTYTDTRMADGENWSVSFYGRDENGIIVTYRSAYVTLDPYLGLPVYYRLVWKDYPVRNHARKVSRDDAFEKVLRAWCEALVREGKKPVARSQIDLKKVRVELLIVTHPHEIIRDRLLKDSPRLFMPGWDMVDSGRREGRIVWEVEMWTKRMERSPGVFYEGRGVNGRVDAETGELIFLTF